MGIAASLVTAEAREGRRQRDGAASTRAPRAVSRDGLSRMQWHAYLVLGEAPEDAFAPAV